MFLLLLCRCHGICITDQNPSCGKGGYSQTVSQGNWRSFMHNRTSPDIFCWRREPRWTMGNFSFLSAFCTTIKVFKHFFLRKLLHRIIDSIERKPNPPPASGGSVIIKCKDFNVINLEFTNTEELNNVSLSLENLSSIGIWSFFNYYCCSVIFCIAYCLHSYSWNYTQKIVIYYRQPNPLLPILLPACLLGSWRRMDRLSTRNRVLETSHATARRLENLVRE